MRSKNMFWAVFFLAIGAILLIQNVFGINVPIIKVLFGLFLIYMGVKVIFGSFNMRVKGFQVEKISTSSQAIFSNGQFSAKSSEGTSNRSFTTAFGSSVLDLTNLSTEDLSSDYKVENAFGSTIINTDPNIPIVAHVESGFANVKIRDQKISALGESDIKTPNFVEGQPALKLTIEAAFGSVIIK